MTVYPADFETSDGQVVLGGQIDFTDPDNQPGGGGFTPVTTADPSFDAEGGQLVIVDASGNDVEVVLPTTPPAGTEVAVWLAVDPGGNTVSVTSGELIDGESEIDLTEIYAQLVVVYTGADVGAGWAVLSQGVPGGGGGLPTGWTADDPDPGVLNGGSDGLLLIGADGGVTVGTDGSSEVNLFASANGGITVVDANGDTVFQASENAGVVSTPTSDSGRPAFSAGNGNGATQAFDAGGLEIDNALLGAAIPYVTVQAAAPTTYLTPIVVDTTAVTGATYAWDGAAYQKIAGLIT